MLLLVISLVQTDMGSRNAQFIGLQEAPVTVDDTVKGITTQVWTILIIITIRGSLTLLQIDAATKSTSGQFVSFSGDKAPW